MVLNELSFESAPSKNEAQRRMLELIKLIRAARVAGLPLDIRMIDSLGDPLLADGYRLSQWRNDTAVNPDLRLF